MEQDIVVEEIIKKFDLYKKQKITYDEFLNMYNEYSHKFTEIEFANLLDVKSKTFMSFKSILKINKNKKLTILSHRHLTEKEQIKKIVELVEKYNLHKDRKIRYVFLKEMHEELKNVLTEIEFANLLGISDENLRNIRNTKDEARIFRNCKLDDEKIEKVRKHILSQYEGKKTYYENNEKNKGEVDFLELYRPFRIYFSENEFAKLLGISEKNLWYTKHNMANPKIKDTEKIRKIEKIRIETEKLSYLRKDEIEEVCKKIGLSVEDFITYYINKGDFFDHSIYKQSLDINNGLYLKKGKIEEKYMEEYNETFSRISRTIATKIKKNYAEKFYNEDLQSDILLFILENCKDLVKNFEYDTKLMERMIWLRARQYARITYLLEKKENEKVISFNDEILNNKNTNNSEINDIELEKIEKIEKDNINDEQLVDILKKYLVQGYSKEEIFKSLSNILNTEKTEILDRMKKYLLENGQVKQNDDGEYEIGE